MNVLFGNTKKPTQNLLKEVQENSTGRIKFLLFVFVTILNIMSNSTPNETVVFNDRDPPWLYKNGLTTKMRFMKSLFIMMATILDYIFVTSQIYLIRN